MEDSMVPQLDGMVEQPMPSNGDDLDLRRATLQVGQRRLSKRKGILPMHHAHIQRILKFTFSSTHVQVEQKRIFIDLRENARGRFLRIAEVTGNNRSTIIIPSSGLLQFRALLDDFIQNDSAVAYNGGVIMSENMTGEYGVALNQKQKKKRGRKPAVADGQNREGGQLQGGAPEDDDKRVFVGNLSWSTSWQGVHLILCACHYIYYYISYYVSYI
jgi:hypothetical protein